MKNKKKLLVVLACLALCVCTVVTGTLAWLTAETAPVVNTFSPSNIKLTLTETNLDGETDPLLNAYKMIPGQELVKDPTVTVTADIASYVFIKVDEVNGAGAYLNYSVDMSAGAWTLVPDKTNVWYRAVNATDADGESFAVLTGNKVTVKNEVNMQMMTDAATAVPKLTFTAYAIQQANIPDTDGDGSTVDEAWALASAQQNP